MATADLTAQRLRELLNYDPETGVFTWRSAVKCRGGIRPAGSSAGCLSVARGYVELGISGRSFWAHRLAFLYMTGVWPDGQVDHINRVRSDNRWSNLRDVSHAWNMQNRLMPTAAGSSGVHRARNGKFTSRVKVAGKAHNLGPFDTAEEASAAYLATKRRLHPGFSE